MYLTKWNEVVHAIFRRTNAPCILSHALETSYELCWHL